jgi:hypothetical protein
MTRGNLTAISLAALVGVAFCAAPMEQASAFTLNAPSLASPTAAGQIDKVQWRHGGGWRGGGWRGGGWRGGWGPGAILGGLAAGALVGGYYGGYYGGYGGPGYYGYGPGYGGDCWRDGWGRLRCY